MASRPQIWFGPLHRAEWAHALSQHVFRKEMTALEARRVDAEMHRDIGSGVWLKVDHDLGPHIRFGAEVTSVAWDGEVWHVDTGTESLTANAVITAVGQLNRPQIPDFPGAETFAGPAFHSAPGTTASTSPASASR